ncbi:hypothetical protein DJ70_07110 [Halorubrum halodurans]|uniref:Uncharacterized protein n=2 Tax=Halorubrum halodurans TaxID=1383851 RepID=A0A256IKZ0_9EURY|nr:hypothetical protein DJ70_07110 [Halorubrum halodurans]
MTGIAGTVIAAQTGVMEFVLGAIMIVSIGLVIAWYEKLRRNRQWHVITDKRIYVKKGIVRENVDQYEHRDVEKYEVDKNLFQNTIGKWFYTPSGTVNLYTAGSGEREVSLTWVYGIGEFTDLYTEQREQQ